MKPSIRSLRWMTAALAVAVVLATLAPAADAGRRHDRRYKGAGPSFVTRVVTHRHGPGSVYVVRRSNAGPAIAGFLGGLFLGATLAHAAPDGFFYYDPYCDDSFVSLEIYRSHLRHHHHPRIVRVIDRDSGHCVRTCYYRDGGWHDWDDRDWDD